MICMTLSGNGDSPDYRGNLPSPFLRPSMQREKNTCPTAVSREGDLPPRRRRMAVKGIPLARDNIADVNAEAKIHDSRNSVRQTRM